MGNLRGIARPADAIQKQVKLLYGDKKAVELEAMMDDFAGVDGLARVLHQGIETVTAKDGRLDTKDLAAYLWTVMRSNPKTPQKP